MYPNLEYAIITVAYFKEQLLPIFTTLSHIEETEDISLSLFLSSEDSDIKHLRMVLRNLINLS